MILDYTYNRNKKTFSISYIKDNGQKSMMNFNVSRFKSFYKTPSGTLENWDGCKCGIKWTDRPSKFEYKTFIKEFFHNNFSIRIYKCYVTIKFINTVYSV